MTRRRTPRILLVTAFLACSEAVNLHCTDRGCLEGLIVELSGELPAEFTLRLQSELSPAPWEVQCTPETCDFGLQFGGFLPDIVRVEIEAAGTVLFDEWVRPSYQRLFPNGPRCDEGCLQGRVDLVL